MNATLTLCLLGSYLVVGFGLGWLCGRSRLTISGDLRTLDDLRLSLAQQAIRLDGFRKELQVARDAGTAVDRGQVEETWQSNNLLKEQLQSGTQRLAQLAESRPAGKRILDWLQDHQSRVDEFGEVLQRSLEHDPPEQLAGTLLLAVSELCQSNRSLEAELQDARRTIAAQQSRLQEAERDARIDPLTKLANRRAFEERLDGCQSRFDRGQEEYAIVLFDLDRFKALNDEFGHRTGDAVLSVFGRILAESVRGYDQAVRLGGEEFAALLPAAGIREARLVAERCRRRCEQAVVHQGGRQVRFTVSAGAAVVREGETPAGVLERADAALYAAKSGGRNRVHLCDSADAQLADEADCPAELMAV